MTILIKKEPVIDILLVLHHKKIADQGYYDGLRYHPYIYGELAKGMCQMTGTQFVFTRSKGMHECGWWKNPDFNQCYHLSLSFFDPETMEHRDHDHKLADKWCAAFFGDDRRLVWVEAPHSPHGRLLDIRHYRLFMDPHFQTSVKPRGEVYTREFTEAGWLSYSDLQYKMAQEIAKR